ncbi:MAG: hypothetical protein IPK78_10440 [Rhodospirillales bacterium]|nr:hypothetical protein [Rhodospirillales bacterium]
MPAHAADGLPSAVKQQVDAAVGRWSASGNTAQAGAAIAELCNQNPGVAPDIVAYAGETAVRAQLPERCLISSSTCQELDQLLALLLERSMQLAGGRVVLAALPAATPTGAATPPPRAVLPVPTPPPATDGGAVQGGDTTALPPAGASAGPPDGQRRQHRRWRPCRRRVGRSGAVSGDRYLRRRAATDELHQLVGVGDVTRTISSSRARASGRGDPVPGLAHTVDCFAPLAMTLSPVRCARNDIRDHRKKQRPR